MAKTKMVHARIEPALKESAEGVLSELGLNPTTAITLFYKQIVLQRGLPFPVNLPNAATRKALADSRAGRNLTHYKSAEEMFEKLGM